MALSDAEIQATKVPYGKNQFKVSDGAGLYLLVKSSGRYWKLAYRFEGKQKTLAFGVYPSVSIDQAREKRDVAKNLLAQNVDPGQIRKQQRMQQREANATHDSQSPASAVHEKQASLVQNRVRTHSAELKIIEQRRLCILQTLGAAKAYSANERLLQQALDAQDFHISFDRLRTDIAWLYEQQVIGLQTEGQWVVYLTQSGLDAAHGRSWIPGIDRPAKNQSLGSQ